MKKFIDIIFICFVTVVLLEITLQSFYYFSNGSLLFYRSNTPIYRKDAGYGYQVKNNLAYHHKTNEFNVIYYTNSKGLRCSDNIDEYYNSANKINIVLNGPSFAFGWGVNYEQCFAAVLQKILNGGAAYGENDFQIINFGVPARGVPTQIKFFKKNAPQYKPKILLQFAYGSMMVADSDPINEVDVIKGYLIDKNQTMYSSIIAELKLSGIIFYSWIAYNRIASFMEYGKSEDHKVIGAGRELNNYNAFDLNNILIRKSLKYYYDLKSYCDSMDTKIIIIFFPLSYEVHNEDVSRWRHLGVENIEGAKLFNKKFCDYLNEHGVTCLNITDDLIHEAKSQRLYYWLDVHWTPYGNEVAARAVAKYLLNHKAQYFNN